MLRIVLLRRLLLSLIVIVAAFAWTEPGHAQATRTWVSGVGDDANPCSRTAPCKTFAGAISKTTGPGEIDCLDPGGFGALTITKPITIDCEAVSNGGVLVAGTNGIVIALSTAGTVNLIGLDFNGLGPGGTPGLNGVSIVSSAATAVLIRNCKIYGFTSGTTSAGIAVSSSGAGTSVVVDNVVITTNSIGIAVTPTASANVAVRQSTIINNNTGINVQPSGSTHGGATVENSTIDFNATSGVVVNGSTSAFVLSSDVISGNGTGATVTAGTGYTLKNNTIAGNTTDISGTLTLYPGGVQ
jgi:Right handed beta helix region